MRFKRKVNRSQSTNHAVRNVLLAQSSRSFNDNFEIGTKGTKIQVYADTTGGQDTTKEIEAGIIADPNAPIDPETGQPLTPNAGDSINGESGSVPTEPEMDTSGLDDVEV